ncbi:insulinase family protein [Streptomyces sp. NPDC056441]|uniref:M16 family metallopeptidase n=1 Tax=Streptomyces sp. NPDC056441 TaxID=3345817 RepID=UPI0036C74886
MTRTQPKLRRTVLSNGLTLLIDQRRDRPGIGVAVHQRVGFRSDPPHRPGLAHLVEHLMVVGAQTAAHAYFAELYRSGGATGGTTHQDYTDFFYTVSAEDLPRALAAEGDRFSAPRVTAEAIRQQVTAVQEEVAHVRAGAVLAGFPWPALAPVLFTQTANTADGFGCAATLAGIPVEECEEFLARHYRTSGTVVTLSGPVGEDMVRLAAETLGRIPGRPLSGPPSHPEHPLTEDRVVTGTFPGRGLAALAVGYRLPAPDTDLPGYLAHMLLARALPTAGRDGRPTGNPLLADARCGFFAPLDARDPDALVITVRRPPGTTVRSALESVDDALVAMARGTVTEEGLGRLVHRVRLEHYRDHDSPVARARAVGRLETLFGSGELLDQLPDLLQQVDGGQLAAAATALLDSRRAVLVAEPTTARRTHCGTAGIAAPGPEPAAHGQAHLTGASVLPRRTNVLFTGYAEVAPRSTRNTEPHVVVVRTPGSPAAELRLALTLSRPEEPMSAFLVADALAQRWAADPVLEGDCVTSVEGVRVHLHGWLSHLDRRVATALARLVHRPLGADELQLGRAGAESALNGALHDSSWAVDRALLWLLAPNVHGTADRPGGSPALGSELLAVTRPVLVCVGDVDPDRTAQDLARHLWRGPAPMPPMPSRHPAAPQHHGAQPRLRLVRRPGPAFALLCARPGPTGATAAARYLAVALAGGHPGARLTRDRGGDAVRALVQYDGRTGSPGVAVTTLPGPRNTEEAVNRLRSAVHELGAAGPSTGEIAYARAFCTGQAARVDSQRALADLLFSWALLGHPVNGLADLTHSFATTSDHDVRRAARVMFGTPDFSGVLFETAENGHRGAHHDH